MTGFGQKIWELIWEQSSKIKYAAAERFPSIDLKISGKGFLIEEYGFYLRYTMLCPTVILFF